MRLIAIPKSYNYVAVFLTLKCNFACTYCINTKGGRLSRVREELTAEQWDKCLGRLKIPCDIPITLSGGEPTTHLEFYDIIERLDHPIDLLTNLSFNEIDFIAKIDKRKMFRSNVEGYKSIRVSFHPDWMRIDKTIEKMKLLQNAGYHVGLFSLNFPSNTESNLKLAEEARKNKVYFFIKDYLGDYGEHLFGHFKYPKGMSRQNSKTVLCKTKELLIGPEGSIFRCHRDLYTNENPLGSLLDDSFEIEDEFRECNKYGFCNPCDIKLKTNRFLQMGSCSVEIKCPN